VLSTRELQDQVGEYAYRPGWRLIVREDEFEGAALWILADLDNSYRPGETVEVRIRSLIPPMVSRWEFERWLAWRLRLVEIHESREWFRRDGKPVFDPHADPDL
jgi:hypothetical protein